MLTIIQLPNNIFKTLHEDDKNVIIDLSVIDVDSNTFTYYIKDLPLHGTANIMQDKIKYTPDVNYNGTDLITYYVNDGLLDSNVSNINLNIFSVNDDPITQDIDKSMNEDEESIFIVLNGSDIDGVTLTYIIVMNLYMEILYYMKTL